MVDPRRVFSAFIVKLKCILLLKCISEAKFLHEYEYCVLALIATFIVVLCSVWERVVCANFSGARPTSLGGAVALVSARLRGT